jgi:hypothetical protein
MNTLSTKIRSFFVILCFIFAGTIGGIVLFNSQASANSVNSIYHPCEQDECEGGMMGDSCQDNPGENTDCSFSGSDCTTGACGHDLEVN